MASPQITAVGAKLAVGSMLGRLPWCSISMRVQFVSFIWPKWHSPWVSENRQLFQRAIATGHATRAMPKSVPIAGCIDPGEDRATSRFPSWTAYPGYSFARTRDITCPSTARLSRGSALTPYIET